MPKAAAHLAAVAPITDRPRISLRLQGFVLIILATALFWAAQHFDRTAQQGHHRLLVSAGKARGPAAVNSSDVFEESVVLVLHHLKSGAVGIVLNKSGKGGPVGADKIFTLHTLDAKIPETAVLNDIHLGVVEGRAGAEKLLALKPPPAWHLTVEGYAGWGGRQLDAEIDQGQWRVIPADDSIMRLEGPKMWEAADSIATAKK